MNFLSTRLPLRFWNKCIPEPMSGCWLWFATQNDAGYGQIRMGSTTEYAHRVAYEAEHRVVLPPRTSLMELDHKCRTRCCVNPYHLEFVSHQENVIRGESPQAYNAKKGTCPNGHPYDSTITRGDRICRRCTNQRNRARLGYTGIAKETNRVTEQQALEILGRSEHGEPTRSISRRMQLPRCTVRDIVIRKNWRRLDAGQ